MMAAQIINMYLSGKPDTSYLEIGLYKGNTFRQVNATIKDSVDPDSSMNAKYCTTSDDFFSNIAPILGYKYDVVFIDGLHHTDQVDRDIAGSLSFLKDGGVVVLHDCNPISEMRQRVPADFDIWRHGWNGDVWKSIFKFRSTHSHREYNTFVIDTDEGVGIIQPGVAGIRMRLDHPNSLDYEFFVKNRHEILNLVSVDLFLKMRNNG